MRRARLSSRRSGVSATTPKRPALSPLMCSTLRSAATNIPAWRSSSTSPRARASPCRAGRCVLRETAVSILYDGGNNVGMLTLYHATRAAIAKAQALGIAVVGVSNSWVSGRSAHYVEMIARAGLVGIHTASANRLVAPFGGTRPALGTNPIAVGLPGGRGPIVFDMGTSAFMFTELQLRERLGEQLPEGVAIDAAGNPTRDPPPPGLARCCRSAATRASASPSWSRRWACWRIRQGSRADHGYLLIVMKPDLLVPPDEFKRELDALIDRVKATPRQPGVDEIRIPSERAFAIASRRCATASTIDRAVHDALTILARKMCDKGHSPRRSSGACCLGSAPRGTERQEHELKARYQPLSPVVAAELAAGLHRRGGMRRRIARALPPLRAGGALRAGGSGTVGRLAGPCAAACRQAPHRRRHRARSPDRAPPAALARLRRF